MSRSRGWWVRVRALFRRREADRELDEEIRHHLELEARRLADRGMDPSEARRQARLRFGGPDQVRREVREATGLSLVDDLIQDVGYALRTFRRSPGFTLVAVLTIGLAIGANTAIFSVVNGVILRPLPYPDPDRLVVLFNQYPTLGVERGAHSPGDLMDYREQADVLEAVGSVSTYPQILLGDEGPELEPVTIVTPGFFSILGVSPQFGRAFVNGDDENEVILSHGFWQRRYGGDPEILGRTMSFSGSNKTIVGVLPPGFRLVLPRNLGLPETPDIWTPIPSGWLGRDGRDRTAHWMKLVGRLRPEATLEQADAQFQAVAAWQRDNIPRRGERNARIDVVPLHDEITRDVRSSLMVLLGAVGFVLLIACANVANLLLARAQRREREMVLRAALGGGKFRILRQVLTEGLVLAGAGAGLGLVLAFQGLEAILALRSEQLPRVDAVGLDGTVLLFALGTAAAAALFFSLAPALASLRADPGTVLQARTGSGEGRRAGIVRKGLIATEVALSLILLVGGGLLLRSLLKLRAVDPGFELENALTFEVMPPREVWADSDTSATGVSPGIDRFIGEITAAVLALPGVETAAVGWPTPLSDDQSGSTYADESTMENEQGQIASSQLVMPGYFETVGIPLLAGRDFRPEDDGTKVVVDALLAEELWPGQSPLGQRIRVGWWSGPQWADVIGVVGTARTHSINEENPPTLYRKFSVYAYSAPAFVVRTTVEPEALVEPIRHEVARLYAQAALTDVSTLEDLAAEQTASTRFLLTLVGVFAGLAAILALVGLYGVVSYAVSARTREIGVRIAFGAGRSAILGMVLREGAGLASAGVALGVAGAYGLSRLLSGLLFGVSTTDPATYGILAGLLFGVALAATLAPARRAAGVDPVEALRSE